MIPTNSTGSKQQPVAHFPVPARRGVFTLSLDFELAWGVRDKRTVEDYRDNLSAVRRVVPALLDLIAEFEIHATWAVVGFLFFESRDELLANLPERRPQYSDLRFSPYEELDRIGRNEEDDPYHFAPSLIRRIAKAPNQEVASHTFSHYYCLEAGQTADDFRADLDAARTVATKRDIRLESLVFPRNQFTEESIRVCRDAGIIAYRGNASDWIHRARNEDELSLAIRLARVTDAYLPLFRRNCIAVDSIGKEPPVDIPASRFLRAWSPSLSAFEPLRLRRIRSEMTNAARNGRLCHLWWHPHNFGRHLDENLDFLRRILDHYRALSERFGMTSLTMAELARSRIGVEPS